MTKIVTFMWYSNDMFLYVFKAEFVALVSLKVPSGNQSEFYKIFLLLQHVFAWPLIEEKCHFFVEKVCPPMD